MKFKINKVESTTNFNITTELEIREDDDTLVYSGTMNFFTTNTDEESVQNEIKLGVQNKYNQIMNERNAKLKDVAQSLLNQEMTI